MPPAATRRHASSMLYIAFELGNSELKLAMTTGLDCVPAVRAMPARDLKGFIEVARKTPGGINYNSPGIASPPHLAGELLARAADLPLIHVSYRGTQPAAATCIAVCR